MGPATLPPAPPAIIRNVTEFARQALGRGAGEPVTLGEVQDVVAVMRHFVESGRAPQPNYRTPFRFGLKTKGRRDASLRSRSNRRK